MGSQNYKINTHIPVKGTVKKQYKTPELNNFGHIAELTAGGSGFNMENGGHPQGTMA